jgi:hypothetical protein
MMPMLMTVEELRRYVETELDDQTLGVMLEALENTIRKHTNNSFREYAVDSIVVYPADIKMGAVNLMKWELNNRDKVGVSSETISRHSVTYFDLTGDNSIMGYPKSLLGFLRPYKKARFGGGLR